MNPDHPRRSMPVDRSQGDRTREKLIAAAERLMAEHGIDGVDLKDIHAMAGQRNRSAIAYHFTDRAGLVKAIGAAHREPINEARNRVLDRLDRSGSVTVESVAEAMVVPLSKSLATQPGRDYIVILAEASGRLGTAGLYRAEGAHTESVIRVVHLLNGLLPGPPATRRLRIGQAILIVPVLLADLARAVNREELTVNQARRRVSTVIDAFVSVVQAGSQR